MLICRNPHVNLLANLMKPNSFVKVFTPGAGDPIFTGAKSVVWTEYFRTPARQLTPQANLKAARLIPGRNREFFI
jgi:hypothetical protein